MHNTPIGPTGTAMDKPIIIPFPKKLISLSLLSFYFRLSYKKEWSNKIKLKPFSFYKYNGTY
jgi:hypothetical protein